MRMRIGLLTLFLAVPAYGADFGAVLQNNAGVKDLELDKNSEAYEKFVQGLAKDPFRPEIHFNLGRSFEANKEFEKALQAYNKSLELSQDSQIRFQSLFNSARILGEMKQVDAALERYQAALEIRPDSREVKTNIELLTQMQQGGGQGENQDQKDQNKDQQGDQDQQDQQQKNQQGPGPTPKPSPRPFKSEQMDKQDVQRILEELKRQEEQIRAKMQRGDAKDVPNEKDW